MKTELEVRIRFEKEWEEFVSIMNNDCDDCDAEFDRAYEQWQNENRVDIPMTSEDMDNIEHQEWLVSIRKSIDELKRKRNARN